jgi:two-component sensor histidine kinase
LRFYAGALLKTSTGLPLGTLCVLDYEPRSLTPHQRNALRVLAKQVMTQLEMRLALKREVLLRQEIDHRVKNSLQAVSALVQIERRGAEDETLRRALGMVEQRINVISLLHAELYRSGGSEQVDLKKFVTGLAELMRSLTPGNIEIEATADSALLDSQRASAVGVIVNESVANSLKHGFPDGRGGTVRITATVSDDAVLLDCRDDGVGSARAAKANDEATGFGARIMQAAATQLGGVLEREHSAAGSRLTVSFPLG